MGCQSSKEAVPKDVVASTDSLTKVESSVNSVPTMKKPSKKASDRLYKQLLRAERQRSISLDTLTITESTARYRSPDTNSSPLAVLVKFLDLPWMDEQIILIAKEMIDASVEAIYSKDSGGNLPIHYAIAPIQNSHLPVESWDTRAQIVRYLLENDPTESCNNYLLRSDVNYGHNLGLSVLYRAVECLPDDPTLIHPPTVHYVSLLIHHNVNIANQSDQDKPLNLLYRRFTRQFDLAEKFFDGDNSRKEVVEYRTFYKSCAANTWKLIELMISVPQKTLYRTVHRAVQVETPPDLLRYIVETSSPDLTTADELGNLPLHYAARTKFDTTFYSKYVMDELLYKYPEAASIVDRNGDYALKLGVQSGKTWIGGGLKSLYDAYPEALQQVNLEQYPSVVSALSMESYEKEEKLDQLDEQHDAIMLVQKTENVCEVVFSMWAHEEDAGVQMLGCVALSRLLEQTNAPVVKVALFAVPAVVNAMKAHPNEVIVQEKACHVLAILAQSDKKKEVSLVASGAVAAIVGAMQAHIGDANMLLEAMRAIAQIVKFGGSDRATVVGSVSGLTAILNAISAHAREDIQVAGCEALVELTAFEDANLPQLEISQTETILNKCRGNCEELVEVLFERLTS